MRLLNNKGYRPASDSLEHKNEGSIIEPNARRYLYLDLDVCVPQWMRVSPLFFCLCNQS